MAGLDPAIHHFTRVLAKRMDPRVKPGGDSTSHFVPENSVGVLPVTWRNACEKAGTLA
jgi:hypothetical protein